MSYLDFKISLPHAAAVDRVDNILAQWRRERPDLDVAPMGLIGRLLRLERRAMREMERTLAGHGLNFAGFDVLATLRRSGPPHRLPPAVLLDTMMVTSGTLTNRIDGLERQGLVRREPNPDDARSTLVGLTPAGLSTVNRAMADHVATQARFVAPLPPEERAALDRLLGRFLAALEQAEAAGARRAPK